MKIIISLSLVLIFGLSVFGQTVKKNSDDKAKPNFSGDWVIDRSKTKDVDFGLTLNIVHNEPEIKIIKTYNFRGAKKVVEQTFYTDNRKIPDSTLESETITQEVHWSGNALVRQYQANSTRAKATEYTNTERLEFSKDGQFLILTMTETIPATSAPVNRIGTIPNGQIAPSSANLTTEIKLRRASE